MTLPLDVYARMVRCEVGSVLTSTSNSSLSGEASMEKTAPSRGSSTVRSPEEDSASTVVGDLKNSRVTPSLVELAATSALRPPVTLMPPPELESSNVPAGSRTVMSPPY